MKVLYLSLLLRAYHNADVLLDDDFWNVKNDEHVELGLWQLVYYHLLHSLAFFNRFVAVEDIWIGEVSHFDFQF